MFFEVCWPGHEHAAFARTGEAIPCVSPRVHETKAAACQLPWRLGAFPRAGLGISSRGFEVGELMPRTGFGPRVPTFCGRIPEQYRQPFITGRRAPGPGGGPDQIQMADLVVASAVQTHQI